MNFNTYFVPQQDVLVRRFSTSNNSPRIESCLAKVISCYGSSIILNLQCIEANIPISINDFLELNSDRFDLGVRLTCICRVINGCQITIEAHDDLELFYRRKFWRKTLPVWHGLIRENQTKKPLADLWRTTLSLKDENDLDPSNQVDIVRSSLNLSAGGIRMELQSPVDLNETCLLYLCLDDAQPTICALCEIVWVKPGQSDSTRLCGLRFSNLLENDLKRIDQFVIDNCQSDPSINNSINEKIHSV